MKIRQGFVSNSSSSSFIIAVPEDCNTLGRLQDYIFKETTELLNPYCYDTGNEFSWSASEITQIVLTDIKEQVPLDTEQILEEYCLGYTKDYKKMEKEIPIPWKVGTHEEEEEMWNRREKRLRELSQRTIDKFVQRKDVQDCNIYVVEYSDNDGVLKTAMEHGDLFNRIPHLKVSKH